MSAAPFRSAARPRAAFTENADPFSDYILVVEAVRDAWLTHGLCAHPSDRTTAESAVAQLYRQSKSREPEFVWVPSPSAGSNRIAAEGLSMPMSLEGNGIHGATAGIATMLSESRKCMDARIKRRVSDWPNERRAVETARVKPPEDAARVGISPIGSSELPSGIRCTPRFSTGLQLRYGRFCLQLFSVSPGTDNKKPTESPTTTRTVGSASRNSTPTTTHYSTPTSR